ncbi:MULTISPECIES: inositol monophosphatase family protein [unclassified Paenibacillus]|uniref:inositol monophosphatase family protein n=1 Tax=unclassified Paenibacillus TaxID=185978 RepID=UPI001AEAC2BE|nr:MULTISPECIES: inositol monophosphatase family protein [unclassified Paenibacillus]MBP1155785.1 myo-inositol-1(or 4)-monophosphatase [Paenibacillus sp. PvP091]MBP1168829.1 myo-inositol-1(or 4)-monophosphatase [Paenibacillus sp. PvR098]MBP2439857.1 myo-inositol-1(or 4)-monophosphatase [Paenibacillus sp. PvP052]
MSYLEIACKAAKEAGKMILSRSGGELGTEEKSSSFDVVTEVDKLAEQMIRDVIMDSYPEHAFLGEEETYLSSRPIQEVLEGAADIPFLWIVDPIDGTTNYVHGIPGFTVSIALACHGELVIGVVYDPSRDELFSAEKGKGTYLNGKSVKVSNAEHAAQCVIATGLMSSPEYREMNLGSMVPMGKQFRAIRVFGSAALHMAYVACGRFGAFWQYGLNAWDMAGGIVLVKEAGGMVTDIKGGTYRLSDQHIICSNVKVHSTVISCLQPIAE